MSDIIICRYCEEPFEYRRGKPGYRDECPTCLIERPLLASKPAKTTLEEHFRASGLTQEQVARSVERFRRSTGKLLRTWGLSEGEIHEILDAIENSPTLRPHSAQ